MSTRPHWFERIDRPRRRQRRRPRLANIRPGFIQTRLPKAKSVLTVEGQHACKLTGRSGRVGSIPEGDELTTAARQDEKTTASRDQPRQSRTDDRAGNGVEDSTAVRRGLNFACFIKEPDDVGRQRQSGAYVL